MLIIFNFCFNLYVYGLFFVPFIIKIICFRYEKWFTFLFYVLSLHNTPFVDSAPDHNDFYKATTGLLFGFVDRYDWFLLVFVMANTCTHQVLWRQHVTTKLDGMECVCTILMENQLVVEGCFKLGNFAESCCV